ncbi:MAG: carboxymuconolactone decarboxylase family protein [Bacteroidia bacterium]
MTKRISIKEIEPLAYKAMYELENYAKTSEIPSKLRHLIKIRASQINGCDYCIEMHTEYAIAEGESERRILELPLWKESLLFTNEEKIVMQLTEEITLISQEGVKNDTYNNVIKFYGEKILAQIIMQIILINSWNRIAISTKMSDK